MESFARRSVLHCSSPVARQHTDRKLKTETMRKRLEIAGDGMLPVTAHTRDPTKSFRSWRALVRERSAGNMTRSCILVVGPTRMGLALFF